MEQLSCITSPIWPVVISRPLPLPPSSASSSEEAVAGDDATSSSVVVFLFFFSSFSFSLASLRFLFSSFLTSSWCLSTTVSM